MMSELEEKVAKVAHEVNRAYCEALGDFSHRPWVEAPDWQKQSAVNGVQFHIANPTASASKSHENWLAEKIASGWKYGPVKDETKKTHPCCVAFKELPIEQKAKDYIFRAVVHAMINLLAK